MSTFSKSKKEITSRPVSPGPIYKLDGVFWNGPDKGQSTTFPKDQRRPVRNESEGASVDYYNPKLRSGPSITIAQKLPRRDKDKERLQAVSFTYEVDKHLNFKTGPSYSFGKSRVRRFGTPEDDRELNWVMDV
eukprot:gene365-667_t